MKKDIEWLKAEVEKQEIVMDKGYIYTCDLLYLIEQLDEPEVLSKEWIDKHMTDGHYVDLEDKVVYADELDGVLVPKQESPVVLEHIDAFITRAFDLERTSQIIEALTGMTIEQVAEGFRDGEFDTKPEITYEDALKVIAEHIDTDEFSTGLYIEALRNNKKYDFLTEKWIDEHSVAVSYDEIPDQTEIVYVDELENLIVPKQELPVIPRYVADWIEAERGTMSKWKLPSRFISDSKYKKDQRRYKWSKVEGNMDKFMSALINGYEVEEEPLYCVEDGKHTLLCKWESSDGWKVISAMEAAEDGLHTDTLVFELTEQEIKDFDPRYWAFRKPV